MLLLSLCGRTPTPTLPRKREREREREKKTEAMQTATLHGTTPKSVIPPSTTSRSRLPLPLAGRVGVGALQRADKIYG
jgi:hypothetical protein